MTNVQNSRNKSSQDDEIDLHQLWDVLNFNKYKIIAAGGVGLALAVVYLVLATPVYKATALVQVNSGNSSSIFGDAAGAAGLLGGGGSKSDIEVSLVKSRMVLGKTVEELGTDLNISYDELPLIGQLSRKKIAVDKALLVDVLDVPHNLLNHELVLEKIDDKRVAIYVPESEDGSIGKTTIEAQVGILKEVNGIKVKIRSIDAKIGQKFILVKQSKLSAIESIKSNLTVNDVGRDTGVLSFTYEGESPERIQEILNSVVDYYAQQDQEFGIVSAGKSLSFIEKQLPITKASLQEAEDKLNEFRQKNATIDLTAEAQSILQNLTKIEADLTLLSTKEAELAELFTKEHPNYQALIEQRKILNESKKDLTKRVSALPQLQQDIIRLRRDVEIEQAVYMQLLNKQQEFSIMQASNSGKVRVVDRAVTLEEPIKPKKPLVLFLLTLGMASLASLYFILKSLLNRTITDSQTFTKLGVDALASIPLSLVQKTKDSIFIKTTQNKKSARTDYLLAKEMPTDPAVEAIRGLRTSLYFMVMEAKNNILMISGATSGLGKSFVSLNLAVVMAQSAKKVLIIDADMRNGYLHEMLHKPLDIGFSEILAGQQGLKDSIRKTEVSGLDMISRGAIPSNPAELLMSSDLNSIFREVMGEYDYIILDVPPIMAVTDAAIMGQYAGTTLMVARYGVTTEQDVENTVVRFANSNVVVKGVIFNGVEKSASNQYVYEAYNNYQSRV